MGQKDQEHRKPVSVTPPELPDDAAPETPFDGQFTANDHYTDLVLSDRDLSGQAAAHLRIQYARLTNLAMAGTNFKFLRLIDAKIEDCNLANADWSQSTVNRVQFVNCRLTGLRLIESDIRNVTFKD